MFNLLFDSADFSTFTAEEIIKYDKDMTTERDRANQLEYAMQQGLQQGELLGEEKKAKSMAIIMLRKGMSLTDIAEISGLSIEAIKQLQ